MVRSAIKKVLVVGLGEVGIAIYRIVGEAGYMVYGYDSDPARAINQPEEIGASIDVMHVCYPYSSSFVDTTVKYIETFRPSLTIVESTVLPGTTEEIYHRTGVDIVHSPIRGRHPNLEKHIRFWIKWVGPTTLEAGRRAKEYYESFGLKVKVARSARETELAKLFETVYRAALIGVWQEMHRVARRFGADISGVAEFIAEVHRVLGDRPVYYPGVIGGHCLIPNTRLLRRYVDSKLLDFVLESNELRRRELEDPEVRSEVEKVKEVWLRIVPRWYYEGEDSS